MRQLADFMDAETEAEVWFETATVLGYMFGVPSDQMPRYVRVAQQLIELRKEGNEDKINELMLALKGKK